MNMICPLVDILISLGAKFMVHHNGAARWCDEQFWTVAEGAMVLLCLSIGKKIFLRVL